MAYGKMHPVETPQFRYHATIKGQGQFSKDYIPDSYLIIDEVIELKYLSYGHKHFSSSSNRTHGLMIRSECYFQDNRVTYIISSKFNSPYVYMFTSTGSDPTRNIPILTNKPANLSHSNVTVILQIKCCSIKMPLKTFSLLWLLTGCFILVESAMFGVTFEMVTRVG